MFFGYGALLATIMAACLIVIAWRCLDFGSARKLQKMKVTTHEPVTLPGGFLALHRLRGFAQLR